MTVQLPTFEQCAKGLSGFVVALGTLGATALPANAGGSAPTQVSVTGSVLSCSNGLAFTVTGGTIAFSIHDSYDATGGEHVTGNLRPNSITAASNTPGDPSVYRIVGDDWFGGSFSVNQQTGVFTSTSELQVLASNGATVANVNNVVHLNRDGTVISHDFGSCTSPTG